jgi:hypothetical protein
VEREQAADTGPATTKAKAIEAKATKVFFEFIFALLII